MFHFVLWTGLYVKKFGRNMRGFIYSTPGLLVFSAALVFPALRHPDGHLSTLSWSFAVGGLALTVLGSTWRTRWQRSASLFALALVGQACALQLRYAPPWSIYQRYFPWEDIFMTARGIPLAGIVLQTAIVARQTSSLWSNLRSCTRCLFTVPVASAMILFLLFVGVLVTERVIQYGVEVGLTTWIYLVSAMNLILVVNAIPPEDLGSGLGQFKKYIAVEAGGPGLSRYVSERLHWWIAGWVAVVCAMFNTFILEHLPVIPDSVSYLFQAKYFSVGHLYLPAPPDALSFELENIMNDGTRWYGYGFPGWPAVLALGVLLGVPWLVNPLVGALTVVITFVLLSRLYDRSMAVAVVLLLAISPWFLLLSSSFMPNPIAVLWALLAILAVDKARSDRPVFWGAVAGFAMGSLFLTRPLEALAIGPMLALWMLGFGGPRLSLRAIVSAATVAIPIAALIFPYDLALTGDATYTPHAKWTDQHWYPGADRLGLGPDIGNVGWPHLDPFPGHGLRDIINNANKNGYSLNFHLFGWSFGSLVFAALAIVLKGIDRKDWLLLGIVIAIVGTYCFYWSSGGEDFGPRYWYQILIPMMVLTVRGIQTLQHRLMRHGSGDLTGARLTAFVAAASLVAAINVLPWLSLGRYHHFRNTNGGADGRIARFARSQDFGDSLVFLRGEDSEYYASTFVLNPATLDQPDTIYAIDAGPKHRAIVRRHFPDRPVWYIGLNPEQYPCCQVLPGSTLSD